MRWILGPKAAEDPELRVAVADARKLGHRVDVRLTWEGGDARRWAREAVESGVDAVVAAGGDGTLHEVVNGLRDADAGDDVAMGLLPYGTANDFAQTARIRTPRPVDAVKHVLNGRPRRIDVLEVRWDGGDERRSCLNMITGGWWAQSTAGASPGSKRLLGGVAYFLEGLSRLPELAPVEISLRGPEFSWSGRAMAFAVGNGRLAGGGIRLCPDALLDDGELDLMVMPAQDLQAWLPRLGDALTQGNLEDLKPVFYRRLPWLELSCAERLRLHLDGEPLEAKKVRIENRAGCLPFFLGPEEPKPTGATPA